MFHGGHGTQTKLLIEDRQQIRCEETWRRRTGDDVFHTQRQQRQQDDDRFLFEPGEHQRQWQIVDATAQFLRQRDRQNNRRVSVITLPGVDRARQPFDIAKVQFVEAVFTTGGVRIRQSSGTLVAKSVK